MCRRFRRAGSCENEKARVSLRTREICKMRIRVRALSRRSDKFFSFHLGWSCLLSFAPTPVAPPWYSSAQRFPRKRFRLSCASVTQMLACVQRGGVEEEEEKQMDELNDESRKRCAGQEPRENLPTALVGIRTRDVSTQGTPGPPCAMSARGIA